MFEDPTATPFTVTVVALPDELSIPVNVVLPFGFTVAFAGVPLVVFKLPLTVVPVPDLTVAVNEAVPLISIVPLDADKVIVGVALDIEHLKVFVPVELSVHAYPFARVAVTVYSPAIVLLFPLNVYPAAAALVNVCGEPL